jgi:biopolymer transport protein TolR
MAMGGMGTGGAVSEINVTPLIDVLLVLLIIFMVIVPMTPKGLEALVPQPPPKSLTPPPPPPTTVVLQVHAGVDGGEPSYSINEQAIAKRDMCLD